MIKSYEPSIKTSAFFKGGGVNLLRLLIFVWRWDKIENFFWDLANFTFYLADYFVSFLFSSNLFFLYFLLGKHSDNSFNQHTTRDSYPLHAVGLFCILYM